MSHSPAGFPLFSNDITDLGDDGGDGGGVGREENPRIAPEDGVDEFELLALIARQVEAGWKGAIRAFTMSTT